MEEKKIKVLTEKEMDEQWDSLDHRECCLYQKMSLNFVHDHLKDIDWPSLSVNPNLTTDIIDKYPSKISWSSISINPKPVSDTILYNYRTKIYWSLLLPHQQLDTKLLVVISESFRKARMRPVIKQFWKSVSRYQKFDHEYVDAYKRFLDFHEMSKNPYLDDETIEKYLLKFDAKTLLATRELSSQILSEHYNYFQSFIN